MDALIFDSENLKTLNKRIAKRVENLYIAASFDEYVSLSHSKDVPANGFEDVLHFFINKDSPSSQPVARRIRKDFPGSIIILVTDERDKRHLEAYFANSDVTKHPSQDEIDSVFPKVPAKSKHPDEEDELSGNELLDKCGVGDTTTVTTIGLGSPALTGHGDDTDPSPGATPVDTAVPALAPEPKPEIDIEEQEDLKIVKGGRGHQKRRILNRLAAFLSRPEPAEAQEDDTPALETVPEPDPGGNWTRWYWYVTVGVAALVAAAVLLPKISNNGPNMDTETPAVTAPVVSEDEAAVTQEDTATVEPGPICWYLEVIKKIEADRAAAAAAASAAIPQTEQEEDGKPVPVTTGTSDPAPAPAPAPQPNRAPTCSISGPSQVNRGTVVTLTASGSDPDGDPVTLSWTTRTEQLTVTGSHSFTVTVTDSHGVSSSCTKIVQVI